MWSTINRLQYAPSVWPEDTQVWVLTGGPFLDRRLSGLLERVEVGRSVEGSFFFGQTTRKTFRVAFEPRATVMLGTIPDEASGNPALSVKRRARVLWRPKGFTREDFGALPGEPLGSEVLTSVRLVFDFDCYPWAQGRLLRSAGGDVVRHVSGRSRKNLLVRGHGTTAVMDSRAAA
jgi:hypothetical protein